MCVGIKRNSPTENPLTEENDVSVEQRNKRRVCVYHYSVYTPSSSVHAMPQVIANQCQHTINHGLLSATDVCGVRRPYRQLRTSVFRFSNNLVTFVTTYDRLNDDSRLSGVFRQLPREKCSPLWFSFCY